MQIVAAARTANAHGFILRKPDDYDTEVTSGGANLSAGEKQRIAIARAVLADPKILILDEATGNVDLETEKQIQEALSRLVATRTTIAIAHRLSTLRNADRLVVLDKGRVAELGTHEERVRRRLKWGTSKSHVATQAFAVDLCGDERDELVLYQPYHGESIMIFTQPDSDGREKEYVHQDSAYNIHSYF